MSKRSVVIHEDIWAAIKRAAAADQRSASSYVVRACVEKLERDETVAPPMQAAVPKF